jgi:hypothetical protein
MISLDLAVNAIVSGLLLGGFYAAVTVGVPFSPEMASPSPVSHLEGDREFADSPLEEAGFELVVPL